MLKFNSGKVIIHLTNFSVAMRMPHACTESKTILTSSTRTTWWCRFWHFVAVGFAVKLWCHWTISQKQAELMIPDKILCWHDGSLVPYQWRILWLTSAAAGCGAMVGKLSNEVTWKLWRCHIWIAILALVLAIFYNDKPYTETAVLKKTHCRLPLTGMILPFQVEIEIGL